MLCGTNQTGITEVTPPQSASQGFAMQNTHFIVPDSVLALTLYE